MTKRIRTILLFSALFASAVLAQDGGAPLSSRAEAFRTEAQQHRSSSWLPEFMKVFLGANFEATQPDVARTLLAVGEATDGKTLDHALSKHKGDPALLAEVFDLATHEARVWKPGRVLQPETMTRLYHTLYRGPPRDAPHRVEPYPIPEPIKDWITEEQVVNDKIVREKSTVARGTLPKEVDPPNQPMFWLPHVEIPLEEARVLRVDPINKTSLGEVEFTRGGKTYVRWFVHPVSARSPSFKAIMDRYDVKTEYLAMPTASPRSLVAWRADGGDGKHFLVKTSLDAEVGELRRVNPLDKGMRAMATTRAINEAYPSRAPPFLREPMVVFPPDRQFGMILREIPEGFPRTNGGRWVPGSALVSTRPDGKAPLLVDMIKRSGQAPMEYVTERLLKPFMKLYGDVTLRQGLVGEPHQQNVLFEIGRNGHLSGRVLLRDLDSYKIDVEQRLRQGFGVRDYFPYPDPAVIGHGKLQKARSYYNDSYLYYVREDYGYMLSRGLHPIYPSVTERAVHRVLDAEYTAAVKRHLGLDVDLAYTDPNSIIRDYRRKAVSGDVVKSAVPRATLRAEFDRLSFNRRVLWVGPHAEPTSKHIYLLHDGAIEMRTPTGRPLGFAFLEPRGSKGFYASLPYPRKEPNARRLETLYEAMDGAKQDRVAIGERVKQEAVGALHFAAAYLVKEGLKALETRDIGAMKRAAGQVATPMFWVSTGVFTVGAKVGEWAVRGLPLPGFARAALPLAAGMVAVSVLSGHVSGKDIAIDTAAFLGAGAVVGWVTDGFLYPMIVSAPMGRLWGTVWTVGKMAATLYLGEKLGAWLRGFGEAKKTDSREERTGVAQKVKGLTSE